MSKCRRSRGAFGCIDGNESWHLDVNSRKLESSSGHVVAKQDGPPKLVEQPSIRYTDLQNPGVLSPYRIS